LEFDTQNGNYSNCCKIDTSHFINFWLGTSSDAYVQVFTVNTSTFAVTTANTALKYFNDDISANSCFMIDSTHFINFWQDSLGIDGEVQVFAISTTYAVTTANSALTFDAGNGNYNSCQQIDANHFIVFYAGTDVDGFAVVITVNTST